MKKLTCTVFLIIIALSLRASHISGGEMYYRYLGLSGSGKLRYQVTLRLFRDCNAQGQNVAEMPQSVTIGIFRNDPGGGYPPVIADRIVNRSGYEEIRLKAPYSCIINPPAVCYQVGSFTTTFEVDDNAEGYIAAYQTCCRISNLSNTYANAPSQSGDPGATYSCTIPGRQILGTQDPNSSPVFSVKDTALVCRGKRLNLDFSATDPDGDSLSYSFSAAYGSGALTNANDVAPARPPYGTLNYRPGYSGTSPLGNQVSIDPVTGIISGIAPADGIITANGTSYFVVNVEVTEWRNTKKINSHRKDFILKITGCDLADAELPINPTTCDGYSYTFSNLTPSSQIRTYEWSFGDPAGSMSTAASPTFTYPDTGRYLVRLVVNPGEVCTDTAWMSLGVYPGFTPDFSITAGCVDVPVRFQDLTHAQYGVVSAWKWDFGDLSTTLDVSTDQHPSWKYNATGNKNVRLIVESSKGCIDTLVKSFDLLEKPPLTLAFKDTLICDIDDLELKASGLGNFKWSPDYEISDLNIPNPIVSPNQTTTYVVEQDYLGCINKDSVRVNVISEVTLDLGPDTTICLTDPIVLRPMGDGLYFSWSPDPSLSALDVKNPTAIPTQEFTTYTVVASVGLCSKTDEITVRTVPYPVVDAGPDHTICYDSTAQLSGSHDGSVFQWTPAATLRGSNTLNPVAAPKTTTVYTLIVTDTKGCPKPSFDQVTVNVVPPVQAFAGNDTAIVMGQPLQLSASGGTVYEWSPPLALNDTRIANPVARLTDNQTYILKVSTPEGCYGHDTVHIKVFKTAPEIFVPNAFTPNNDGHNDVFLPYPVGIAVLNYFRVYNRWGQEVFSTNRVGHGWDGKFRGQEQGEGTFVWMAEGIDYTGKKVVRKGTVLLTR